MRARTLNCRRPALALAIAVLSPAATADVPNPSLQFPIVFVAQIPPMRGYPSLNDIFTNHLGGPEYAPRGSDLYILYPDGSLKNLTQSAGWGCVAAICATPGAPSQSGYPEAQDPHGTLGGIAVRDPQPHWGAQKVGSAWSSAVPAAIRSTTGIGSCSRSPAWDRPTRR